MKGTPVAQLRSAEWPPALPALPRPLLHNATPMLVSSFLINIFRSRSLALSLALSLCFARARSYLLARARSLSPPPLLSFSLSLSLSLSRARAGLVRSSIPGGGSRLHVHLPLRLHHSKNILELWEKYKTQRDKCADHEEQA